MERDLLSSRPWSGPCPRDNWRNGGSYNGSAQRQRSRAQNTACTRMCMLTQSWLNHSPRFGRESARDNYRSLACYVIWICNQYSRGSRQRRSPQSSELWRQPFIKHKLNRSFISQCYSRLLDDASSFYRFLSLYSKR